MKLQLKEIHVNQDKRHITAKFEVEGELLPNQESRKVFNSIKMVTVQDAIRVEGEQIENKIKEIEQSLENVKQALKW